MLSEKQISKAISYNSEHALDVLPALLRATGIEPSVLRPTNFSEDDQQTTELIKKLAELQQNAGLGADGIFGRQSRLHLANDLTAYDATALYPQSNTSEAIHWQYICKQMSLPFDFNRPTLIALRGLSLDAPFTHPLANISAYQDMFIFINIDGEVTRFAGSTLPYQHRTKAGADITDDGINRDQVATIRPGYYQLARKMKYKGHRAFAIKTIDGSGQIPCWRDLNYNNHISESEAEFSESQAPSRRRQINDDGAYATSILLHPGFDNPARRFSSIGCQTTSIDNIDFLYQQIGDEPCNYILLDAVQTLANLELLAFE